MYVYLQFCLTPSDVILVPNDVSVKGISRSHDGIRHETQDVRNGSKDEAPTVRSTRRFRIISDQLVQSSNSRLSRHLLCHIFCL